MQEIHYEYTKLTKNSLLLYKKAKRLFAGGVNHNARFYRPYPIFIKKARGKFLWDEDNRKYVDYWMGHTSLILGHSPQIVSNELVKQSKRGTLFGMGSKASVELAEMINKFVKCAEMMRFCNTGAEATMYTIRLARAYTKRKWVIKMEGGWHGYNTQLNKGVHFPFDKKESAGIIDEEQVYVETVRFNDIEKTEEKIRKIAKETALIIVEPVLGAGGCIPAKKEYLNFLREISNNFGILLAFDEIITGFRLALGGAQEYYGIEPDLATLGKIVGGGLPIGVVCGKKEILMLADPTDKKENFVGIGGGTFSENPLTMVAGISTLRYLSTHKEIYQKIGELGEELRFGLNKVFNEYNVKSFTTGLGSLFMTHFIDKEPENAFEANLSDKELREFYGLHQICRNNFILSEHPSALSSEHDRNDVKYFISSAEYFAEKIRRYYKK